MGDVLPVGHHALQAKSYNLRMFDTLVSLLMARSTPGKGGSPWGGVLEIFELPIFKAEADDCRRTGLTSSSSGLGLAGRGVFSNDLRPGESSSAQG